MTLTLRAVSLNDQPLTQPITAHFDLKGGTIGRADHNTMALPDPERHISRQQADISAGSAGYLIKNVGSANPIVVSGQSLAQGETAPLMHGDKVRIGGYLLEVIDESANDDGEASTITRGRAAVDARTPAAPRSAALKPVSAAARGMAAAGPAALGDLSAPLSSSNPFADLLGSPTPPAKVAPPPAALRAPAVPATPPSPAKPADPFGDLPAPAGVSSASAAWAPAHAPTPRLPDDFDPFAAPAAPAPAAQAPAAPAGAGVFDDLIPAAAPASIDELFGLQSASQRDPLADFMAKAPPAGPATGEQGIGGTPLSTDPLALFGGGGAPPPPAAPQGAGFSADLASDLRGAFKPPGMVRPTAQPRGDTDERAATLLPTGVDWLAAPASPRQQPAAMPAPVSAPAAAASEPVTRVVAPTQVASPMPPAAERAAPAPARPQPTPAAPAQATWEGSTHELWKAFCEGAGVRLDPPQGLNPELMRVMGTVLRSAIEGTLQLVAVRAATKHELRAQVTVIQARSNNPLKFSPDAQSALEQMLQPPVRGFLSGPAAMTDVMQDLVGHAIGTMAGTRAALEGVLGRFRPEELEAKLVGKTMLDSFLPMNRKAKLWELYLQHYDAIREEAQEDFHTLFGKAFLAAYEQQLERLRREMPGPG